MSQKKIEIRTTLKGNHATMFKEIMEHLGTTQKTETIRSIIKEAHRNIKELKQ